MYFQKSSWFQISLKSSLIRRTCDLLVDFANMCLYHSAYASSIVRYVFISSLGAGWANASLASPLYTLRFRFAAIAKKRHCIGCSTWNELWGLLHGVVAWHTWIHCNKGMLSWCYIIWYGIANGVSEWWCFDQEALLLALQTFVDHGIGLVAWSYIFGQFFELSTGEETKSLFFGGSDRWPNCIYGEFKEVA